MRYVVQRSVRRFSINARGLPENAHRWSAALSPYRSIEDAWYARLSFSDLQRTRVWDTTLGLEVIWPYETYRWTVTRDGTPQNIRFEIADSLTFEERAPYEPADSAKPNGPIGWAAGYPDDHGGVANI